MKRNVKLARILAIWMSLALVMAGCGESNTTEENSKEAEKAEKEEAADTGENESTAEVQEHAVESTVTLTEGKYSEEKLDDTWDETKAVKVQLSGNSISAEGSNIEVDGSKITITGEGTYLISGELEDGQIIVDTDKDTYVKLVFNGVNISCSDSAPVYIKGGNTIITLAEGSENTVTDGETYLYEEDDDEPGAAIFAKDDLTFNGTGSLTVNGNYNNGIQSKDDLKFVNGVYIINAEDDGMVGKDSVSVKSGNFTIVSGGDGIKSTNIEETDKGYVLLENGSFRITSDGDAIQAETMLRINDGTYELVTGSGSGNSKAETDGDTSTKGLKSYVDLIIAGGEYSMDTCDDAVHSGQNVQIDGGNFVIITGDDGIHAEENLVINGGEIDIQQSYEGIEGFAIVINDGDIRVVSKDDGINAAGSDGSTEVPNNNFKPNASAEEPTNTGTDGQTDVQVNDQMPEKPPLLLDEDQKEGMGANPQEVDENGGMPEKRGEMRGNKPDMSGDNGAMPDDGTMPGENADMHGGGNMRGNKGGMPGEDQGASLTINGGTVYVNAEGDGLDANGDILMTGGDVTVHGPTNGGNGTLDYGASCKINGGTFRGVGSAGMAQNPDEDSEQPIIVWNMEQPVESGMTIVLKDSSGKVITEITTEKKVQWYAVSSPELVKGETYTISVGDTEKQITL
ncbi:MAG: carbohydrate-binding domain-containing protein [Oliverpabstia sp.]